MATSVSPEMFIKAATAIRSAKALMITAGAGMGVDSGLPDFRGPEGLWKAYPPLKERGLTLPETSTPRWFHEDPNFAWGFFGHRMDLYSRTQPHEGFQILQKWGKNKEKGCFVFTSNVDGHFQKAGFPEENVMECHGSLKYFQLVDSDHDDTIWQVPDGFQIEVNEKDLRAPNPLPMGPPGAKDQKLARPNVLMFNDWTYIETRKEEQQGKYMNFLKTLRKDDKIVVIEIGAGNFVPTVRNTSERIANNYGGCLIRINPREPEVPSNIHSAISFPMFGLECLKEIDFQMDKLAYN